MPDAAPLKLVFCWHLHQPCYRVPDAGSDQGEYRLPWTYLHAIKDYVDMAAHLEACPAARAVVNFTPILLEQLDKYSNLIKELQISGGPVADPLLHALASRELPQDPTIRDQLLPVVVYARMNKD